MKTIKKRIFCVETVYFIFASDNFGEEGEICHIKKNPPVIVLIDKENLSVFKTIIKEEI